jgi:RPA family protein
VLNRIELQGIITRINDHNPDSASIFITIKQRRKYDSLEFDEYYQLFANGLLAEELSQKLKVNQIITVEGSLRTFRHRDGTFKTSIQLDKINKIE